MNRRGTLPVHLVGWVCCCLAAAQGPPVEESPLDRVLSRFNDCLVFHAGYDHAQPAADLAAGQAAPRGTERELTYAPGLNGQALASGTVTYRGGPNLSLAMPGTALIWVSISRPDRDAPEGYLFPLRIFGSDPERPHGMLMIGKGDRRNGSTVYVHAESTGHRNTHIGGVSTLDWRPGEWHLLALTWRPGTIEFTIDGGEARLKTAPPMPRGGTWFVVAAVDDPKTGLRCLIDDAMVLNRPLSREEIRWIWDSHEALRRNVAAAASPDPP